jgi:hypothetical protein
MRPVPHLIDRRSRLGEYAMSFMVPLFLLRTIDPLLALLAATALMGVYVRHTFGRPEGHLVHLAYRVGIPLSGLLDRRVRRYVP